MTRQQFSEKIYFFGLILLAAAMPLSVFLMSVSQIILLASWLISGNIFDKTKTVFQNSVVAVLVSIYFMHLAGGFYSTDHDYFFRDIRIKLPLLILPVIIFSSPKISVQWLERVLVIFILATFVSTITSMGVYFDLLPHKKPVKDIRDISVFVSHIRFSLFICLSIFFSAYFIIVCWNKNNFLKAITWSLLIIWFVVFLYILEAMTGMGILIIVTFILLIYYIFKQKNILIKTVAVFTILAASLTTFYYIKSESEKIFRPQTIQVNSLAKTTVNGNPYQHCAECQDQENGNLVWNYFCEPELAMAWNKRSRISYAGKDLAGNDLKYTLVRFLTSKGLRKDSAGVFALTNNEINFVENGIANVEYQKLGSLKIRLHKTIMEYHNYKIGKNPTGSSMMQRIEYWKAGMNIFNQNFWFGVGTGDVQKAFDNEYNRINSPLSKQWRLRAHNQYLTIALTFGLTGLLFFMFSLIYPIVKLNMKTNYLYIVFFIIVIISMLTEDTLETQAGVTFYAFFNTLVLYAGSYLPLKK